MINKSGDKGNFVFRDQLHFFQSIKDKKRAEAFGGFMTSPEIIKECLGKLTENKEVAIIKDTRCKQSNQIRIFKTSAGGLVAIPCYERDDGIVEILTLLNVHIAEDQFWFVNHYNSFAKSKDLPTAKYKFSY